MRLQTKLPPIDKTACDAIIRGLEEHMSPRARHYRKRVGIMKTTLEQMDADKTKRLHDMRVGKLSANWGHRRTRWTDDMRMKFAIGQLIAMPDRKYYGIIQEAYAHGIRAGQPFIHVRINRCKACYIAPLQTQDDIRVALQRNTCLAGKTIHKAFNKKRDTWTLYAQFGSIRQHVADVFGMDLSNFEEYTQDYVRPADARKPGRPRKPILHEFI